MSDLECEFVLGIEFSKSSGCCFSLGIMSPTSVSFSVSM